MLNDKSVEIDNEVKCNSLSVLVSVHLLMVSVTLELEVGRESELFVCYMNYTPDNIKRVIITIHCTPHHNIKHFFIKDITIIQPCFFLCFTLKEVHPTKNEQ